ncbi:38314_t:CDS:2 [Gigaspora margarita]|uniref:38314_t:CDS:1 n=1 Tax=Gigaspora margarita TaxID=4874 RepID=A0ABN7URG1_GIGMA|nr:38314_t:CDS:2 [Gigaspora margarita]
MPKTEINNENQEDIITVEEIVDKIDQLKTEYHSQQKFEGGFSALLQISMGLKCIHEQGLIHKDFHSGNILIGSNGYCIADLGLCYPVDSNNSDYDEDSEIYQQFEEAKTYNETIKMKRICGSLSELYKKYKGQVREVKLEELNEIGGELFTEFCQKNGYEEGTEKARKEFKQLLLSPKSHEITLHPETV